MSTGEPVVRVRSVRRFWGAHAPRRNALVKEKFAMARALPRGYCSVAPPCAFVCALSPDSSRDDPHAYVPVAHCDFAAKS